MRNALFTIIITIYIASCTSKESPEAANSTHDKIITSPGTGKTLFTENCVTCHPYPDGGGTDIILNSQTFNHLPEPAEGYFSNFISDSKGLRAGGDAYAIAIHKEYDSDYDHYFKGSLDESEIKHLIAYIRQAN